MKTDIRNNVGLRIKELRRKGGITQEKFALMTGINRSYLADIEQGNRNFGFDTLDKIGNVQFFAHFDSRIASR